MDERQVKLLVAKKEYRAALCNLETISEEIHARRRSLSMGMRERGVGAEGGNDDIANFKMESDGLSMMSVTFDEEGNATAGSEEETDAPRSTTSSVDVTSSSSSHPHPPTPRDVAYPSSSLCTPCPHLPSSSSLLSSSCPGVLELPSACSSHDLDSICGSGHASPLLGDRSQCSGASSPECDQERGDRAEGAEEKLGGVLSKLTLAVVQVQSSGN